MAQSISNLKYAELDLVCSCVELIDTVCRDCGKTLRERIAIFIRLFEF